MIIILDAMGGDNAPLEVIKGAAMAASEYDVSLRLVGPTDVIKECAEENGIYLDESKIEIIDAPDVITMEDPPLSVRKKKNSSMTVSLNLLAGGGGDAMVSAGNTGALYAGASLIVMRIKGFRKAAIATVFPFKNPTLLLDSGANTVVSPENLCQFALMGSVYMEKVLEIDKPRVGLLNNGTEANKGTELLVETHALLSRYERINFVGNVEARAVPFGACDVLVTDGFTGNIFLKLTEGLGEMLFKRIKAMYKKNFLSMLSAAVIKKEFKAMKKEFDASEYGGAPILGISKPVIKTHGSSDALEIKNAVRQAVNYVKSGVTLELAESIGAAVPSIEVVHESEETEPLIEYADDPATGETDDGGNEQSI
ncbi:MAG: phosphate acyltransferase PlsX [Eubacteriales bacterium]|jgi:glycerol-3-phosphate acyltransferase PlsX